MNSCTRKKLSVVVLHAYLCHVTYQNSTDIFQCAIPQISHLDDWLATEINMTTEKDERRSHRQKECSDKYTYDKCRRTNLTGVAGRFIMISEPTEPTIPTYLSIGKGKILRQKGRT